MKLNGHFHARKKADAAKAKKADPKPKAKKKKAAPVKPVAPQLIPLAPLPDDLNTDTYA